MEIHSAIATTNPGSSIKNDILTNWRTSRGWLDRRQIVRRRREGERLRKEESEKFIIGNTVTQTYRICMKPK